MNTELKANKKVIEETSESTAIEKTTDKRNDEKEPSKKASSEVHKPVKERKTRELKDTLLVFLSCQNTKVRNKRKDQS